MSKLVLSYTHFLCSIDLCHLVYPPAFSIWCSCGSWGDFDGGNKTSVTELTVLRKVASIAIIAFSAKVSGSKTLQIKFEPKQVGSLRCIGKSLPEKFGQPRILMVHVEMDNVSPIKTSLYAIPLLGRCM